MAKHGIVHIEIAAASIASTAEFYRQVFNWNAHITPGMDFYATFETGDGVGGGFNLVSDENPAGTILLYISTDNIEASLAKIEQAGGVAVAPRTAIPNMGWFALFKDPTGNLIGLFEEPPNTS